MIAVTNGIKSFDMSDIIDEYKDFASYLNIFTTVYKEIEYEKAKQFNDEFDEIVKNGAKPNELFELFDRMFNLGEMLKDPILFKCRRMCLPVNITKDDIEVGDLIYGTISENVYLYIDKFINIK